MSKKLFSAAILSAAVLLNTVSVYAFDGFNSGQEIADKYVAILNAENKVAEHEQDLSEKDQLEEKQQLILDVVKNEKVPELTTRDYLSSLKMSEKGISFVNEKQEQFKERQEEKISVVTKELESVQKEKELVEQMLAEEKEKIQQLQNDYKSENRVLPIELERIILQYENGEITTAELIEAAKNVVVYNQFPLRDVRISSYFGTRTHPITGVRHFHRGIDLPNPSGTPVYPMNYGYVSDSGYQEEGLGYYVRVNHGNGMETTYGHLSSITSYIGQVVNKNTQIGLVGSTGMSTGPHVHFEVTRWGEYIDPYTYVTN